MARKRKYYRITATEFDILAHAVQSLVDECPGSHNDLFTRVVADIKLAHAPKVKQPKGAAYVFTTPVTGDGSEGYLSEEV